MPGASRSLRFAVWCAALAAAVAGAAERQQLELELVLPASHGAFVTAARFAPDGERLVSITAEGELFVWEVATGLLVHRLRAHAGRPAALAFSPDGTTLVTAARPDGSSPGGEIRFWDTRTYGPVRRLETEEEVQALAYSPDGRLLAAGPTLRDAATGEPLRSLALDEGETPVALAFSPDGSLLAAGTRRRVPGGSSSTGYGLWDPRTGERRWRYAAGGGAPRVAFSPDGTRLAIVTAGGEWGDPQRVEGWDVAERRLAWAREPGAALLPDGSALPLAARRAPPTAERRPQQDPPGGILLPDAGTARRLREWLANLHGWDVCPAGERLAARSSEVVGVWNAATGELERLLGAAPPELGGPRFSPDGARLAAVASRLPVERGWGIALWDARAGRFVRAVDGRLVFAFSPDGSALYTQGGAGRIQVVDATTGERRELLPHPVGQVSALAFLPGGRELVVSASPPGSHVVTSYSSVLAAATGAPVRELPVAGRLAVSPDGRRVAGVFNALHISGREPALADPETGTLVTRLAGTQQSVGSFAFSPDGAWVAAGSYPPFARDSPPSRLMVWDARTGERHREFEGALEPAFSPDGRWLAALYRPPDSREPSAVHVQVWRVGSWEPALLLSFPETGPTGVEFSPDGRFLVVAARDGRLEFRRLPDGALALTLRLLAAERDELPVEWLAHTPEGYYDGSPGVERRLRWRVGEELLPGERLHERLYRPERVRAALAGE